MGTDEIAEILRRYVSPIHARVIAERCARSVAEQGGRAGVDQFAATLRTHARLFVRDTRALDQLLADVVRVHTDAPPSARERMMLLETEEHLRAARLAARELCVEMGASRLVLQRFATAVSELGRNIISYTPGGTIKLFAAPPDRVAVLAEDRGRGIPNLDEIFAGTYRSRTGLGRGLLGVKKLMDSFEITTGPRGTSVRAEAIVR